MSYIICGKHVCTCGHYVYTASISLPRPSSCLNIVPVRHELITEGIVPLYIGMVRVVPAFRKSVFPWEYALNPESVFTKGYVWSKYVQKSDNGNVVKVNFHQFSSCCYFSVPTHVAH